MRFSEGHWAVFVRRSPVGGPWKIEVPGIGATEAPELAGVVGATRALMAAELKTEIAALANEQLNIWVQWEAVLEDQARARR